MAPLCPWQKLAPANLTVCEADVCGWITQPANTWTNVGFVLAGVFIWRESRRIRARFSGWFGPIAIATALSSAAFHGTSTFVGQALDQSVMFYGILTAVSIALLWWFETVGIALFVLHNVAFAAIEIRLWFRDRETTSYRSLAGACACFAVAYALWWLDKLGIVCDPNNHVFTLHGAWHLIGALSFPLWFRHFAQFETSLSGRTPSGRHSAASASPS